MKRRAFLGMLGLIGCTKYIPQPEMSAKKLYPILSGNKYDLFIIVGDSKMKGTSSANHVAPVPAAGTVKQYNQTTGLLEDVTGEILYISSYGSPWPRFGINYNASTGRIPVLVNTTSSGSKFYSPDGSTSWGSGGALYSSSKVYWDDAIIKSRTRPKFLVGLGVNDQNNNLAYTSETLTAATSLITSLNADYNNPPIYINLFSKEPSSDNALSGQLKVLIKSFETTYSNVYCTVNEGAILCNGATIDGIHYNATGNNRFGEMLCNYIVSSESDKDIRRLYNSNFYTDFSSPSRKAAYSTFVTSAKANGYWDSLAALFVFRSEFESNYLSNIIGFGAGNKSSPPTFTANDKIATNGTSSVFVSNFHAGYSSTVTQDNIFIGAKTGTVVTPVGVNAALFGAAAGTVISLHRSSFGNIAFFINSSGVNDTDTVFANNTHYALQRDSSTSSAMWKAGSVKKTSALTSSGIPTDSISFGASQSTWLLEAEGYYLFCAKNTGFNYSAFISDIDTLLNTIA